MCFRHVFKKRNYIVVNSYYSLTTEVCIFNEHEIKIKIIKINFSKYFLKVVDVVYTVYGCVGSNKIIINIIPQFHKHVCINYTSNIKLYFVQNNCNIKLCFLKTHYCNITSHVHKTKLYLTQFCRKRNLNEFSVIFPDGISHTTILFSSE